jgi:F-type H+-transporting ATPase subunit epsilon|tara:strand:- start:88 stop:507 length:420 start_codon:yes stop_codon:yes gene_type:complete
MANGKILLDIVTPEKKLMSAEVDEVTAPGFYGEFGILPDHTTYLCQLGVGVLTYRMNSASYFVSVIKGYAEVGMNKVTVLAEVAERAEDVDIERAEKALERAKNRMSSEDDSVFDFERAELALKRASTRISVARESGLN